VRYEFEQGMIRKQPAIEDLFFLQSCSRSSSTSDELPGCE